MKNIIKYLTIAAAATLFVSCFQEKSEIPVYVPASAESGAQVFFKGAPTTQIKLSKEKPSLDVTVARASTEALSVGITATGADALKYFNVPATVDFAADVKEATLTISAKDVSTMPMNEYYPLTIAISDPTVASLYGTNEFTFEIGVSLPWIDFDKGTMIEGWWGETEPEMPLKYQQISDHLRYCVVEGCWGHNTIADGGTYDVQPYTWYWDTETNVCYVPAQYIGYSTSNGDVYVGDEAAFYNLYWPGSTSTNAMKQYAGQAQGSDEWFAFCDMLREAWGGPGGDPFPYYDGEGKFYLGDYFFLVADGVPTGRGYQFGGTQDIYECSFAVNYTIGVSYEGLLTDKNGVDQVMGNLTVEGVDVTDVYALLVPGKDPEVAIAVLEGDGETEVNLEEVKNCVKLSEAGGFFVPMIEEAAGGFYSLVAVPVDKDGGFAWDYAVYESFAYGEIDPLYLEYTGDDLIAAVDKDKLLSTQWVVFAAGYGGSAADRTAVSNATFTDAEDNAAGDDLITCTGILASSFPFTMEYYKGVIYTLASQSVGTYSSYDVVYSTYSDENFGGNYAMYAAYVADGIIAFVNGSTSDNFYGMALWAYSGETLAGYLQAREYILLVDPAILEEPASAPMLQNVLNKTRVPYRNGESCLRRQINPSKDWSRDVVASGRVMAANAKSSELKTIE